MPETPTLGQLARAARDGAGLTQQELAERVGCTLATVSQLERDKHPTPRKYLLAAIERECGVPMGSLTKKSEADRDRGERRAS